MQRASESLHIDKTLTSLRLTGGKPADIVRLGSNPPDLWIAGGGYFEKDTIMKTNLFVNERMYGNIHSNEIAVDILEEGYTNSGIHVISDVKLLPSADLTVDTIQSNADNDLNITTSSSNRINVHSDGIDMHCNSIYNVERIINLSCPELTISSANLIISSTNLVSTGNSYAGNLIVQDLYVHTMHGLSPISFNDIADFGKGANFKQLVKLLAASAARRSRSAPR